MNSKEYIRVCNTYALSLYQLFMLSTTCKVDFPPTLTHEPIIWDIALLNQKSKVKLLSICIILVLD